MNPAERRFLAEIREQPDVLLRLVERRAEVESVVRELERRGVETIRLVGHGSSDAAASYGVYAFGILPGWTAFRDSISLTTYYRADLDYARSAVVALSQSGRTPDVVSYVTRARARGALTIGVTNEADSGLAAAAGLTLLLHAGEERAVAASKTLLNTFALLALLAGFAARRGDEIAAAILETA